MNNFIQKSVHATGCAMRRKTFADAANPGPQSPINTLQKYFVVLEKRGFPGVYKTVLLMAKGIEDAVRQANEQHGVEWKVLQSGKGEEIEKTETRRGVSVLPLAYNPSVFAEKGVKKLVAKRLSTEDYKGWNLSLYENVAGEPNERYHWTCSNRKGQVFGSNDFYAILDAARNVAKEFIDGKEAGSLAEVFDDGRERRWIYYWRNHWGYVTANSRKDAYEKALNILKKNGYKVMIPSDVSVSPPLPESVGSHFKEKSPEPTFNLDKAKAAGLRPPLKPRSEYPEAALKKGTGVEIEHTKDADVAELIAAHHLDEDPKYYDKLEKIEGGKHKFQGLTAIQKLALKLMADEGHGALFLPGRGYVFPQAIRDSEEIAREVVARLQKPKMQGRSDLSAAGRMRFVSMAKIRQWAVKLEDRLGKDFVVEVLAQGKTEAIRRVRALHAPEQSQVISVTEVPYNPESPRLEI